MRNFASAKWMLYARCHAKMPHMLAAYVYFPVKIMIKWQKLPHGFNSYKGLQKIQKSTSNLQIPAA